MNTVSYSRHYYTFLSKEALKGKSKRLLDFGCGDGSFLVGLADEVNERYGIDIDDRIITQARSHLPEINFQVLRSEKRIPFKDNFFDVVTLHHVLEHVNSETQVVKEIYRVLKPGGLFLLASPYYGLFTWADTANLRFRFPKIHKYFFKLFLGENLYQKRFVNKIKEGLYGDCSISRHWHKHYRETEIKQLLQDKFEVLSFSKYSLFSPFLLVFTNIWHFLFKRHNPVLLWLLRLDNMVKAGELSYNFFVVSKKQL